jgi:hypothetical protein
MSQYHDNAQQDNTARLSDRQRGCGWQAAVVPEQTLAHALLSFEIRRACPLSLPG